MRKRRERDEVNKEERHIGTGREGKERENNRMQVDRKKGGRRIKRKRRRGRMRKIKEEEHIGNK